MNIQDIREALRNGRYRITRHANAKAQAEELAPDDLTGSDLVDEILEEYPDDRPHPSCLVYGTTPGGDPVHTVWGYNADGRSAVLITVYRPDPGLWIDLRFRRPRNDGAE